MLGETSGTEELSELLVATMLVVVSMAIQMELVLVQKLWYKLLKLLSKTFP